MLARLFGYTGLGGGVGITYSRSWDFVEFLKKQNTNSNVVKNIQNFGRRNKYLEDEEGQRGHRS